MVTIVPEKLTDKIVSYRYYPEFSKEYGIVSVNRKTKERSIDKVHEEFSNVYAGHALCNICKFIDDDNFPEKDVIAWYQTAFCSPTERNSL